MRNLLASILIVGALGASSAHANRWDQRQPAFAERRPLFQRRQAQPAPAPQAEREPFRQQAPQAQAPAAAPAAEARQQLQPADAGRRAQQQYGGRILSVTPADSGYHVRLLRDGEVSVVTVPNQ